MGRLRGPQDLFRHAVVAGASIAGLLAARVLADHFDTVSLVEPDKLPNQPEPRKGVPQGRHVHVLLARGLQVLERLFPGLSDELGHAGALTVNAGREIAWHHGGGWRTAYDSDLSLLAMTRPLLESRVAERVRALPQVKLLENQRVLGVRMDQGAVTGVEVSTARRSEVVDADLVVDATGRGSAMPRWLEEFGYATPVIDTIPVPLTYSTCLYRRGEHAPSWRALLVTAPGARRTGFAFAVEDNCWLVTQTSLFDEPSPGDHAAFLSFARSLPIADLHDEIRGLEPVSEPVRYRFSGSQRRRYEQLKSLPDGLIGIGDSVCSFNPIYGQGMTVAALEAEKLDQLLSQARSGVRPGSPLAVRWYREIGRIIDLAWQGVSIEDLRYPELAARKPTMLRPLQWYMDRVHRATHRSPRVTDQFYRVIGFLDPPAALFRARIMADVLLGT